MTAEGWLKMIIHVMDASSEVYMKYVNNKQISHLEVLKR